MALKDLINPRPVSEPDDKGETETAAAPSIQVAENEPQSQVPRGVALSERNPKHTMAQYAERHSQMPRGVSEVVTPSGISIYYQAAPKRLYRVNGLERPSVSEVLDILAKGGLPWWGMKVGIGGVFDLTDRHVIEFRNGLPHAHDILIGVEETVSLLTERKLTVNHVRDQAGDRGTSVHTALEIWAEAHIAITSERDKVSLPNPQVYAPEERGYVEGLRQFLIDSKAEPLASEVMVASVKHKYAGRYDLDAEIFDGVEVFTHITPKGRGDKKEAIEGGLWRIDLKTSGAVYDSYHLQIEAYEEAARECGYPGTENRGILRVTEDGRYELKRSKATFADFKAVLSAFKALQRVKAR